MSMAFTAPAYVVPVAVRASCHGRDDLSIGITLGATSEPGVLCRVGPDRPQA